MKYLTKCELCIEITHNYSASAHDKYQTSNLNFKEFLISSVGTAGLSYDRLS